MFYFTHDEITIGAEYNIIIYVWHFDWHLAIELWRGKDRYADTFWHTWYSWRKI